jgi:hypothetical protein
MHRLKGFTAHAQSSGVRLPISRGFQDLSLIAIFNNEEMGRCSQINMLHQTLGFAVQEVRNDAS